MWDVGLVEAILIEAAKNLPVEQSCLSYLTLDNFLAQLAEPSEDQRLESIYVDFITHLHKAVENRLCQRVGAATKCTAWNSLPLEKQKKIMESGCFLPMDNKFEKKHPNAPTLRRNQSLNAANGRGTSSAIPVTRNPVTRSAHFVRSQLRSTGPRTRISTAQPINSPVMTPRRSPAINATNPRSQSATSAARPLLNQRFSSNSVVVTRRTDL